MGMFDYKIKSKEEIKSIVRQLREIKPGIKIVTTNGAFDLAHSGHAYSLEKAKSYGDILIVGLNSDSSIRAYKSPKRPIIGQNERAYQLACYAVVDYVVIFDETDPRDLLEYIKPNIHAKSISGFKGIEKEVVERNGGKIELFDDIENISTTEIIRKIKSLAD